MSQLCGVCVATYHRIVWRASECGAGCGAKGDVGARRHAAHTPLMTPRHTRQRGFAQPSSIPAHDIAPNARCRIANLIVANLLNHNHPLDCPVLKVRHRGDLHQKGVCALRVRAHAHLRDPLCVCSPNPFRGGLSSSVANRDDLGRRRDILYASVREQRTKQQAAARGAAEQ